MLVGVLCVLGRLRVDGTYWRQVLPMLKPALLVEMRSFDPTAGPSAPWVASQKVTEGLVSDDVRRRGSFAVQAMLRWLEVARLTRGSCG